MNERIKLLAEQARKYAWENETHWSANAEREALFEQKFAELIVREFCQKLEDDGMVEIAIEMKQHFGVEE